MYIHLHNSLRGSFCFPYFRVTRLQLPSKLLSSRKIHFVVGFRTIKSSLRRLKKRSKLLLMNVQNLYTIFDVFSFLFIDMNTRSMMKQNHEEISMSPRVIRFDLFRGAIKKGNNKVEIIFQYNKIHFTDSIGNTKMKQY